MRIALHTGFSGAFFPSSAWGNSRPLRAMPAELPRFAPMEHDIDYAENPGNLTRSRYAREHTLLWQGCLIPAKRPSGHCIRASKSVGYSDRNAFSNEQAHIAPDPPTHGSDGRRSLENPTSEGLSLPNSHGVGSHEPHRILCFEVSF